MPTPPPCVRCGRQKVPIIDQFKSGKWKQKCAACLQPAARYRNNASPPHKTRALAEGFNCSTPTPPYRLNPLSSLLASSSSPPMPSFQPRGSDAAASRLTATTTSSLSPLSLPPLWTPTPSFPSSQQSYPSPQFTPHRAVFPLSQPPPSPISAQLGSQHTFSSQRSVRDFDTEGNGTGNSQHLNLDDFRQAEAHAYSMPVPRPAIRLGVEGALADRAITLIDAALLHTFYTEVDKVKMEECSICNRKWFNLNVWRGECDDCRKDRRNNSDVVGFVPLFGSANGVDPGVMPPELPDLTSIEESLLARVHVFMEIRQHRGVQYKYRGHICHFAVNVGKVFNRLPLIPQNLDIIVVKPAASDADDPAAVARQFRKDYKVRRAVVLQWLRFLIANHPGYADVELDDEAIQALPEDDYVDHLLPTVDTEPSSSAMPDNGPAPEVHTQELSTPGATSLSALFNISPSPPPASAASNDSDYGDNPFDDDDEDEDAVPPEETVVPDLVADTGEFEALQEEIRHRTRLAYLSMGNIRNTPLAEFNQTQALYSLAFPSLFPTGAGEFVAPRMRDISFSNYVKLLTCYKDGRFARHPRFRYAVFNQLLRHQATEKAGFFVKQSADGADLTVQDITDAFNSEDGGSHLVNSVIRWSASVRGTRAFWQSEGKQLEAVIRQLKSPSLFITLSAADYHWHDLLRFSPRYQEWFTATSRQRVRIAQDFVRDNPHIVAVYFHKRFELFKKHVIVPAFDVVDYWDRYEWQGRGSTHSHGLYYCRNAPNPDIELGPNSTDFTRARLARYWNHIISAMHPDPNPQQIADEGSTLSLAYVDMRFDFAELSSILTRCYIHRCLSSYCLRKDRRTGNEVCRFDAPWRVDPLPRFERPLGKSYHRFMASRNHSLLNAHVPTVVLGWRANTDVQVCTSTTGVVQYMGVYASKGETQSLSYKDLAVQVLPYVNASRALTSFASKLMNKLIGERDYSAQEVFHTLFGLPLVHCSRTVINVDCRPESALTVTYTFRAMSDRAAPGDDSEPFTRGRTVLQKYKGRPAALREVSYLDFLLHHDHAGKAMKRRPRAPPRVLNYMPRYSHIGEPEHFARVKLMLHHPFRDIDDLFTVHGATYATFAEAYAECVRMCTHELQDSYGSEELGVEEEDPNLELLLDPLEGSFDELAQRRPGCDGLDVDEDRLGDRPVDRLEDWLSEEHDDTFGLDPTTYWADLKRSHPVTREDATITPTITLQGKQQLLFDLIVNHYRATLAGGQPPQVLVNLDGQGGTGKTFVIDAISRTLESMASSADQETPIMRCAPTGVAAFLISGKTINSAFRIPIQPKAGSLEPLSVSAKQQLQATFRGIYYLVIDEKSMVSLAMLSWIHQRCGEIRPSQAEAPFAGFNVVISGDFYQLPPVGRRGLYDTSGSKSPTEAHGQSLYRRFRKTITLDTVMRQQGDAQSRFRDALQRLRVGTSTQNDWVFLMQRCQASIAEEEKTNFQDAVRLCSTRKDVQQINHNCLREFPAPVILVLAKHDRLEWANIPSNDAGNLHNEIALCVGARVMLLHNVWTERGLVNGAAGVVEGFLWDAHVQERKTHAPKAVLLAMDDYDGPALFTRADGRRVIPIFTIPREFFWQKAACTRVQFPITLAWAITIHKSQGMSLDKVVIRLSGTRDFVPGLLYVAVSRVKTVEGLMFESPITFSRLRGSDSKTSRERKKDADRRAGQHVVVADTMF